MLGSGFLLLAALAASPDSVSMTIDSARHEIVVTTGSWHLPAQPEGGHHEMAMPGTGGRDIPLGYFRWPIDGWFRGFRLEVRDQAGQPLPRHLVHHLIVVNFSRRQLLYNASERLFGAGAETDDARVPKTVGVPMSPSMHLGMYVGWHNDTGKDLHGVRVRLTLLWTPRTQMPRPVSAMPIYMDANLTVGGSNTFDLPPGRFAKAHEFTLPVGGRLLAAGGHMHDYGVGVRLEDVATGKTLVHVDARRDGGGAVHGMERRLFGVAGDGLKLARGRRYRIAGVYDNPTTATLPRAAMAHMVGLFAPRRLAEWPAIDPSDADYRRDLAALQVELRPDGRVVPASR